MAVYTSQNNKQSKKHSLGSKVGIALICVSAVLLINLIFNIVKFLNSFMLGTFGLFSYAILLGIIVYGIMLIRDKKISIMATDVVLLITWLAIFLLIIHIATSSQFFNLNYGKYIAECYNYKLTCGGALLAIIAYPFKAIFSHIVAIYTVIAILLIAVSAIIVVRFVKYKDEFINALKGKNKNSTIKVESNLNVEENEKVNKTDKVVEQKTTKEQKTSSTDDLIIPDEEVTNINTNTEVILPSTDKDKEKAKNILGLSTAKKEPAPKNNEMLENFDAKMSLYENKEPSINKPKKFIHNETYSQASTSVNSKPDRKLTERDKENLKYLHEIIGYSENKPVEQTSQPQQNAQQKLFDSYDVMDDLYDENITKQNYKQSYVQQNKQSQSSVQQSYSKPEHKFDTFETEEVLPSNFNKPNLANQNSYSNQNYNKNNYSNTQQSYNNPINVSTFNNQTGSGIDNSSSFDGSEVVGYPLNQNQPSKPTYQTQQSFSQPKPIEQKPVEVKKPEYKQEVLRPFETKKSEPPKKVYKKPSKYIRPDISMLTAYNNNNADNGDYSDKARMLEETLESFNAPAKVVSITKGPAFTRFELQMQQGIPVKRVNALVDDIAMTLRARGDIRMEIPVPGKNAFGVEIPNEEIETVGLREIIESYNFQGSKSPLTFALGKDITGEAKVARIDKMPHLLVAGATGSGKSVCLNSMLVSLLFKAAPEDLKLILIDPKRVEFTLYNGLPHMLLPKAITDVDKAVKALDWLIKEMDRRYNKFAETMVRNIEEYNDRNEIKSQIEPKMPFIVFIVDELGDLMLQRKKEVEEKIIRLTQLSRACGIYLVIATQRPSVDVITGTIKANLPSRIAFAVSAFPDSKTILDQGGAEKLLGKGDMLYSPNGSVDLLRIQGAFVSSEDVAKIVNFVKENNECEFDSDIEDEMFNTDKNSFNSDGGSGSQEFDSLLKDALRLFIKQQNASISKLQRAFGIGFPRAAKIVDQMEAAGFVGPKDSKNLRPLYITQQEFEERFGEDL